MLEQLKKKEEIEGNFHHIEGDFDDRDPSLKTFELHQGFSTTCGLKGSKLSGGQKQRIAIARAVIRKPNILILDEATSALDEDSQKKVQQALENVMDGRTSIVIAHRLTTVEKCNRVIVIDQGKVIEEGSFNQLKGAGGFFTNLAMGMAKKEEKKP